MTSCGCWTDEDGYWQLCDECREEERRQWREMMKLALEVSRRRRQVENVKVRDDLV